MPLPPSSCPWISYLQPERNFAPQLMSLVLTLDFSCMLRYFYRPLPCPLCVGDYIQLPKHQGPTHGLCEQCGAGAAEAPEPTAGADLGLHCAGLSHGFSSCTFIISVSVSVLAVSAPAPTAAAAGHAATPVAASAPGPAQSACLSAHSAPISLDQLNGHPELLHRISRQLRLEPHFWPSAPSGRLAAQQAALCDRCSTLPLMRCAFLQPLHARQGSTGTCTASARQPLSYASQPGRAAQLSAQVCIAVTTCLPRCLQNPHQSGTPLPSQLSIRPAAQRQRPPTPNRHPHAVPVVGTKPWLVEGMRLIQLAAHKACLPPSLISPLLRPGLKPLTDLLKTTDRLQPIPFPAGSLSDE